jgi:hypothetical protein
LKWAERLSGWSRLWPYVVAVVLGAGLAVACTGIGKLWLEFLIWGQLFRIPRWLPGRTLRHWGTHLVFNALELFSGLLPGILPALVGPRIAVRWALVFTVANLAAWIVFCTPWDSQGGWPFLFRLVYRFYWHPVLLPVPVAFIVSRMRLRKRRAEGSFCSRCGYNLTGNTSGVCPECGSSIPASTGGKMAGDDLG